MSWGVEFHGGFGLPLAEVGLAWRSPLGIFYRGLDFGFGVGDEVWVDLAGA